MIPEAQQSQSEGEGDGGLLCVKLDEVCVDLSLVWSCREGEMENMAERVLLVCAHINPSTDLGLSLSSLGQ